MTTIACGLQTGALPAVSTITSTEGALVFAIVVAPNPSATVVTTFQQSGTTIVAFNKPVTAGGAMDPPYKHCAGRDQNDIDPTAFGMGAGSAFVTYLIL